MNNKLNTIPTFIYVMGGVEEIGKNMHILEHDNEMIIVDSGIKFAPNDLLGINSIVPSFSWLKENEHKIKGIFITHGHEDHIGGIPYLLKEIKIKNIYAPKLALELIRKKLTEHKDVKGYELIEYSDDSKFSTEHFKIDFYRQHHSIPDSFAVIVESPNGIVVNTGDYRLDLTPIGDSTNYAKIAEVAKRNVTLFLADSTNSERDGFTSSEYRILNVIDNLISKASGRVIFSSFASNVSRIEEVVVMAIKRGRKICVLGRSMQNNIATSKKIGYLNVSDNDLIEARDVSKFKDNEILIICTGSQGEGMAALNVMAKGKHAWISFKPTDKVLLSSSPIPGNLHSVEMLINQIYKSGPKVYVNNEATGMYLHSTGHASKQEQQLMLVLINPKYFMPIHGEYRMLIAQRDTAMTVGIPKENVFIMSNGDKLKMLNQEITKLDETIDAEDIYIDGNTVSTKSSSFLVSQRRTLSEHGIVFITLAIDKKTNKLLANPAVVSRGTFFTKESMQTIMRISKKIKYSIDDLLNADPNTNPNLLKSTCKKISQSVIWQEKRKKPLVSININYVSDQSHMIKKANEGIDKSEVK